MGAMHLTARHEFNAPCDRVYAMTTDPAFLAQVCRDLGAVDSTVDVSDTPPGAVSRVSLTQPTPGPLVAFAGPTITVGQEFSWGEAAPDGSRTARLLIKVAGMPVHVDAVARLAPTAAGCAVDYDGTLSVKVPLIGPAMEKQAQPFLLETLEVQQRSGDAWLAAHD